jgi:photosystem II stability/assembly factor-like uncharacterized protein
VVVGDGDARHYDGVSWSNKTILAHGTFNAIFGLAANDIYAAGDGGTIFHYNGSAWSKIANIPTTTWHMYAIWASSPSDVYVMGYLGNLSHYNGDCPCKYGSLMLRLDRSGRVSIEA